jgi:hypothetical protein
MAAIFIKKCIIRSGTVSEVHPAISDENILSGVIGNYGVLIRQDVMKQ